MTGTLRQRVYFVLLVFMLKKDNLDCVTPAHVDALQRHLVAQALVPVSYVRLGSTATWDIRCANSVGLVLQTTIPMHQHHAQIVLQAHMLDVVKRHAMCVKRVKSTVMRIQRRHALPACLDSTG